LDLTFALRVRVRKGSERQIRSTSAAGWLSLAATPTFAVMALLAAVHGGGMPDMMCSAAGGGSPWSGMVTMYALMSAFHLGPWLRLLSRR
jgi:hypothetical protein